VVVARYAVSHGKLFVLLHQYFLQCVCAVPSVAVCVVLWCRAFRVWCPDICWMLLICFYLALLLLPWLSVDFLHIPHALHFCCVVVSGVVVVSAVIIIIIIIIMYYYYYIIPFVQGIHTYIPETNHVSRVYSVVATPPVLLMVHIALSAILNSFVLLH
jgi:hypothetical protein